MTIGGVELGEVDFLALRDSHGLFLAVGAMVFSGGSSMIWSRSGAGTAGSRRVERRRCGQLVEEAGSLVEKDFHFRGKDRLVVAPGLIILRIYGRPSSTSTPLTFWCLNSIGN